MAHNRDARAILFICERLHNTFHHMYIPAYNRQLVMNKVWKFLNDVRIHAIILFPLWLSRVQIESSTYRMTISFILIKVDFYLSLP